MNQNCSQPGAGTCGMSSLPTLGYGQAASSSRSSNSSSSSSLFVEISTENEGGGTGSHVAPSEMSDVQFNASIDALMSGDSWLVMHYAQQAPLTSTSSNNSDALPATSVVACNTHTATTASPPRYLGSATTSSFGPLGKSNIAASKITTISNPAAAAISFPGLETSSSSLFNVSGGLPFSPLGGGIAIPPAASRSLKPMVSFAPIQSPSSSSSSPEFMSSDFAKPSGYKRKRMASSDVSTTKSITSTSAAVSSFAISAVSEDEGERSRRRRDRNQREQQRSQQIAQQIGYLRDMLSEANVQFKPDKYTTLVTVGDFIRSLQERVEVLDAEHKKLLNTILQTSHAVNSQYLPQVSVGGSSVSASSEAAAMKVTDFFDDGKISPLEGDEDGQGGEESVVAPGLVSTLDYKAVFDCCPVASAVTSIDGRFLDCNHDFELMAGFLKSELVVAPDTSGGSRTVAQNFEADSSQSQADDKKPARSMSLFNIITREHMERVFLAMSQMLRVPFLEGPETLVPPDVPDDSDAWSGVVTLVRKEGVKVNLGLSLVRGGQGRPKFFSCTMVPVEDHVAGSAAVG